MHKIAGYLIRYHRNKQAISQEGLCKGICVVSYLSKIEQGLVQPSTEIIKQLFQRLSLTYFDDPKQLREARSLLDSFFEKLDMRQQPQEEFQKLKKLEKSLLCSPLCVDVLLANAFMLGFEQLTESLKDNIKEYAKNLHSLKGIMNEQQLFLYYMFFGCLVYEVGKESIQSLKKAGMYQQSSHQQFHLGYQYYYLGKQSKAVECYGKAYYLASEEGNAPLMMEAALHLGNCYCMYQRDQELMYKYYHRCIKLAKVIGKEEIQAVVYYNIGSSFLSWGMLEEAKSYLERSVVYLNDNDDERVLYYQKLALVYCEMEADEKMKKALAQAKHEMHQQTSDLFRYMQIFVELHCEETTRYQKEYVEALEHICFKEDMISYGFRNFHIPYLICAYKKQRRYKEALQLKEEIDCKFS